MITLRVPGTQAMAVPDGMQREANSLRAATTVVKCP